MAIINRFFLVIPLALVSVGFAQTEPQARTIDQLREEADAVLKLGNVSARAEIAVVFELADRLADQGNTEEAIKYYEAALKNQPWSLGHQLSYAKLLMSTGKEELAKERAELVIEYSEYDSDRYAAMQLLGREVDSTIPEVSYYTGKLPALILVTLGETQPLLVKEVATAVEEQLGITVLVQELHLELPRPRRDKLKMFVETRRQLLIRDKDKELIQEALKKERMTIEELDDDKKVIRLYKTLILLEGGQERAEKLSRFLTRLEHSEKQWHVNDLMLPLGVATKAYEQNGVKYLGITEKDIYADGKNFLFGVADKRGWGVMSYRRFTADFNGNVPNHERLLKRTIVQCLSSAGHLFGFPRCSDPNCARAYPHSLVEHDAKDNRLCKECREGFDKAFEPYKGLIAPEAPPDNAKAYLLLAQYHKSLGQYDKVIEAYKQAIRIKPDDADTHSNLGFAYGKLERYTEAIEACKQAVRIKPDMVQAHYILGSAYGKLERYAEAIEAFKQAVRIKPDLAEAHSNLGIAYVELGRYTEAIAAYKQAIRIEPDVADAYCNLGIAYGRLGRYAEAIEVFKQAIRIKPDDAHAHYNLGLAYSVVGDRNSALEQHKILKDLNKERANKLFRFINEKTKPGPAEDSSKKEKTSDTSK